MMPMFVAARFPYDAARLPSRAYVTVPTSASRIDPDAFQSGFPQAARCAYPAGDSGRERRYYFSTTRRYQRHAYRFTMPYAFNDGPFPPDASHLPPSAAYAVIDRDIAARLLLLPPDFHVFADADIIFISIQLH